MINFPHNISLTLSIQNRSIIFILWVSLLPATFSYGQDETQRPEDTVILDIDGSGDVNALTDGLLILRSLFGFSDEALTNNLAGDCENCDATSVNNYVTKLSTLTFADLEKPGP
jgi:hypothetical protein